MPFRSRRFPSRSGPRRKTLWGSQDSQSTAVAAATSILLARFTAAQLDSLAPMTVVRERGVAQATTDQVAASELVEGAIGFAIVSETAAAAGAASIPGPVTNADWDGWYAWYGIQSQTFFLDATGFLTNAGMLIQIDSKAMRKVNDSESLVVMVENASASAGFNISMQVRTLFMLH